MLAFTKTSPNQFTTQRKELSDLNTDRSRVFQEGRYLVNGNFGLSSEKNQNEDLEYVTPRQNGGVISKTGSTGKVEYAVVEFNIELCYDVGCLKGGGFDPDLIDEKIEEQCHASGDSYNEIQDDTVERSVEMEDDSIDTDIINSDTNGQEMGISNATEDDHVGSNSEHLETIGEAGGSSPAVDENKLIETAESSFLSETSFANEMKVVQATAADPEEGNTKVYMSKISNEENQGNYDKSFVVQELEKIPENNANEKQTNQIANEQELDFSSGKPVATSTPLDHPVGLRSAAPLLKPAHRAVQQPTDITEKQNRISNKNFNFQKKTTNRTNKRKELYDLNNDRSRVFQEGRDLVNGNFGLSSENNQDEDVEYVTPRQNGGVISKTGSTGKVEYVVDEFNIELCSNAGCLKGGGLDPGLRDEKIEEQCHASGDSYNEIQDDTVERSVEMEDDSIDTDIIDKTSFANEMKAVQATAADPEEGNTKVYLSKISNEENQGNYDKSFVVQEPEKIPENNANEKQTTQIANEHQLDFLSGKPVATSTPLDHPVGLRSTTPLLKPAPRAMQQPTDIIEKQNRISNKNLNFQKKLLTDETELCVKRKVDTNRKKVETKLPMVNGDRATVFHAGMGR
ncbi:hypothetical protein RYX36_032465 [Vicia faba]